MHLESKGWVWFPLSMILGEKEEMEIYNTQCETNPENTHPKEMYFYHIEYLYLFTLQVKFQLG